MKLLKKMIYSELSIQTNGMSMSNSPEDKQKKSSERIFKLYSVVPGCDSPLISGEDLDSLTQEIYTGKNPMQAAKKAFTRICRVAPNDGMAECMYIFSIQEVTENSTFKLYDYSGKREKLDKPKEINVGGAIHVVHYQSTVSSWVIDEQESIINIKGVDK